MWAVELRWVVVFLALYTAAVFFLGRWHARRSGFRFPLDPAPLGVLRLSPDLRYTEANPAARQILGLNAPQGRLPEAGWRALLEEDLQAARATGVGRSRLVSLAGERALRWWMVPEPSGAWLFVIEDRGAILDFSRCGGSWPGWPMSSARLWPPCSPTCRSSSSQPSLQKSNPSPFASSRKRPAG